MNQKLIVSAASIVALVGHSAFAQSPESADGTAYIGLSGGVSHFIGRCDSDSTCDKNRAAAKVYAGYVIGNDISIEASYYALGSEKVISTADNVRAIGGLRGAYWGVGVAYRHDLGDGWGAVGRGGLAISRGKFSASEGGISIAESRTSFQPYAGVGISYALTRQIKLETDFDFTRVGFQTTDAISNARVRGTNNVSNLMFGATFQF